MRWLWNDLKTQFAAFARIQPIIMIGNFVFFGALGLCFRGFIEHLSTNSADYTGQNIGHMLFWMPYFLMLIYALYANLLALIAQKLRPSTPPTQHTASHERNGPVQ